MLQVFDYLQRKWNRLTLRNHAIAAFHDHVADNLLTVAHFLDQVAQKRLEVLLQIDKFLLQEQGDDFDGGQRDLKVDVRDELLDEAEECRSGLLGQALLSSSLCTNQLH